MKEVNEQYFEKLVSVVEGIYTLLGGYATSSVNKISGGYILGVDFLYSPFSFLSLGIRTGFLSAVGSFKTTGVIFTTPVITNGNMEITLVPLSAGVASHFRIPGTSFVFGTGAFIGFGFAGTNMTYNIDYMSVSTSGTIKTSGTDLFADISGRILYEPASFISFGVQRCYRIADIKEMRITESTVANIKKHEAVKDSEGNLIEFDYGGVAIQAMILFAF